jgi:hypothetical protein
MHPLRTEVCRQLSVEQWKRDLIMPTAEAILHTLDSLELRLPLATLPPWGNHFS